MSLKSLEQEQEAGAQKVHQAEQEPAAAIALISEQAVRQQVTLCQSSIPVVATTDTIIRLSKSMVQAETNGSACEGQNSHQTLGIKLTYLFFYVELMLARKKNAAGVPSIGEDRYKQTLANEDIHRCN